MSEEVSTKLNAVDLAVKQVINQDPLIREALEIFDLSVTEYERLLLSMYPVQTMTSNVTTLGAQGGH